jgi:hypothetical protein
MVGYTSSFGIGGYDVFLVKADKTGNLIMAKNNGGNDWDFAYSIDTHYGWWFYNCGNDLQFWIR